MNKQLPGARKGRDDRGKDRNPVKVEEKKMLTELLKAGKTKEEAARIIEERLNTDISTRKLAKMKPEIADGSYTITSFGDELRQFIEQCLDFDKMSPDSCIKIFFVDRYILIPKEFLSHIIATITEVYNLNVKYHDKLHLNEELLFRMRLFISMNKMLRVVEQTLDFSALKELTKMYKDFKSEFELNPNFRIVEKICQEIKPDIKFEEIMSLVKKYSDQDES
jgi:Trp operon repressor